MRNFIYNAFKSLDEIEQEEKKQSLSESKKKDKITYVGDPEAEVNFFNKAMNAPAVAGEGAGLTEDARSDKSLPAEVNTDTSEIGIPESYDYEDEGYYHDIENWLKNKYGCEVAGFFFNIDKYSGEVTITDIDWKLEEKIPRDLKKAYLRVQPINKTSEAEIQKGIDSRRGSQIDFEKAEYKPITKDEALKIAKDKNELAKLRFIIKDRSGNLDGVIIYNKDGKPISHVDSWYHEYENKNGNTYSDSRYWPVKHVIEAASDIYYTDEDDWRFNLESELNPLFNRDIIDNRDYWSKDSDYDNYTREIDDAGEYAHIYQDPVISKRMRNRLEVKDTGKHRNGRRRDKNYYFLEYKQAMKDYKDLKAKLDQNPDSDDLKWRISRVLKSAKDYWQKYKTSIKGSQYDTDLNINYLNYLYKLVFIKYRAYKRYLDSAKSKINELKNDSSLSPYAEKKRDIKRIENYMDDVNNRIAELQNRLAQYKLELDNIQNSITEEEKEEYKAKFQEEMDKIADKYYKFKNELNKMLKREDKPEETQTESLLKEEKVEETLSSYLKLYIEDANGKEFIEDCVSDNEEDAKLEAQKVFNDNNYTKVVAVKLEEKEDSIDTIELWTSDSIKESLNESKKFNIKDETEVTDAIAYSKVEDTEDDTVVAIDPNIESRDESAKAEIGDALLECRSCKSIRTIKVDDLVRESEDSDVYNKDDPCPHCGSKEGYNYIAQLASPEAEEVKELDITEEETVEETPEIEEVEEKDTDIELQEESFDTLINKHLTSLYENIKSYKTNSIKAEDNKIIVEGILTSDKDKELNTKFSFTLNENAGNYILSGNNDKLAPDENSFNIKCSLDNNALICEDLNCKYIKAVDNQKYLIEGYETINE